MSTKTKKESRSHKAMAYSGKRGWKSDPIPSHGYPRGGPAVADAQAAEDDFFRYADRLFTIVFLASVATLMAVAVLVLRDE